MIEGSAFNRVLTALVEKRELNKHVISGTNLPLLMEAFNIRQYIDDINQIVYDLINDSSLAVRYGKKMLEDEMDWRL